MNDNFQYRLSEKRKAAIAQNLIDILQNDAEITPQAKSFIYNWIRTGPEEKRKAFFDVWDIVLKNYLPTARPILFRSCNRISKNSKVASFTGRLEFVRKFSKGQGALIICDTKESLQFDEKHNSAGEYKRTFYPLVDVLRKDKVSGKYGFSERMLNEDIGEDEYIMRVDLDHMYFFKWIKNDL